MRAPHTASIWVVFHCCCCCWCWKLRQLQPVLWRANKGEIFSKNIHLCVCSARETSHSERALSQTHIQVALVSTQLENFSLLQFLYDVKNSLAHLLHTHTHIKNTLTASHAAAAQVGVVGAGLLTRPTLKQVDKILLSVQLKLLLWLAHEIKTNFVLQQTHTHAEVNWFTLHQW